VDYQTIAVTPLSPVIGAQIDGIDISKPMGNQTFAEVHHALMRHQVIFFREQEMTLDEHKRFGQLFGTLHVHPFATSPEGHPEVLTIHADETSKRVAGHGWHTDVSCDAEPPLGSILYLKQTPQTGGDTMFASMYAAYDALSAPLKQMLEGLEAEHRSEHLGSGQVGKSDHRNTGDYPSSVHPVVRTHPVTRRKALYVNAGFTRRIKGLERKESDALLEFLFDHVRTPEFHCRFAWEDNSVAFWDNRAVQHHALWDYYPQVRSGFRVTVAGDQPFLAKNENPEANSETSLRLSGYDLKGRPDA
jgi:taurine dioxygenase